MKIQITSAYDEIAWYSKLIGKIYTVIESDEHAGVKVKRGNGKYSYWVGEGDYIVIK